VKSPGKDTVVNQGSWLYFGMPPSEDSEEHVKALEKALFPNVNFGTGSRSCNARHGLMAFTLEFDCFAFPSHIGSSAAIGTSKDSSTYSLNLRGNFGLNLAGIVNKNREVTWFPGPEATVQPGDWGLVVRCPCQDGTTEPTVFDEQLQPMMDKTSFAKVMASGGNKIAGTRA
jgi:hypothetical protein